LCLQFIVNYDILVIYYLTHLFMIISTQHGLSYVMSAYKDDINILISANKNSYAIAINKFQVENSEIKRVERLLKLNINQKNEFDIIISTAQSVFNLQNS